MRSRPAVFPVPSPEEQRRVATALCPGSFDPVTNGHLDIIERTARHFDEVIVAVIRNPQKTLSLFTLEERQSMLADEIAHLANVRIEFFKGLLVEFAKEHGAEAIVKGLRAVSDFDYELQMAQMNQQLSGIDTFFMPTSPQYSFLSSSLVREVARFGGDVSGMVPPRVAKRLAHRFAEGASGPT
jgi:pantetheine-phosphate adenylyltransferase